MMLFAQVQCKSEPDMLNEKKYWGLCCSCIGLFICLSFFATVEYLYRTDKIDERLADLKLITIDDYTTQTCLPIGLYEEWVQNKGSSFTDDTIPINEFSKDMNKSIKRQIADDQGNDLTEEDLTIVDIDFGFNNTTMYR